MKTTITEIRKISGFGATSGDVRETDFNAQICATSNLSDEQLIQLMKAAPELLEALKNILRYAACAKQVLGQLELMTSLVRLKYGNLDTEIYKEILKTESLIDNLKIDSKN